MCVCLTTSLCVLLVCIELTNSPEFFRIIEFLRRNIHPRLEQVFILVLHICGHQNINYNTRKIKKYNKIEPSIWHMQKRTRNKNLQYSVEMTTLATPKKRVHYDISAVNDRNDAECVVVA